MRRTGLGHGYGGGTSCLVKGSYCRCNTLQELFSCFSFSAPFSMNSFRSFQSVLLSRWPLFVLFNQYSFLDEPFSCFSISTPISLSSFYELFSKFFSDIFFHSCHYCKCEHGNIHCHAGWRQPTNVKNTKNTSLSGKGFKGVGKHYCYGRWVGLIIKWKPNISNMHSISSLYNCTMRQLHFVQTRFTLRIMPKIYHLINKQMSFLFTFFRGFGTDFVSCNWIC